ncbi:MAG: hypothetical protein ACYC6B_03245 [Thermoleophilia bacterium]
MLRYDLATPEGYCEYTRHAFTHIPAMIYFAKDGRQIETTEQVEEKEALKLKLENLLKQ